MLSLAYQCWKRDLDTFQLCHASHTSYPFVAKEHEFVPLFAVWAHGKPTNALLATTIDMLPILM
jgi:hypothetical protein